MRKILHVVLVLLLTGCVPIGVRVQNMFAASDAAAARAAAVIAAEPGER